MNASPCVKWAGGKRSLLSTILDYVPKKIRTYYEPFVGGGALFFELANQNRFRNSHINDVNPNLMLMYSWLPSNVEGVLDYLRIFEELHQEHGKEFYYKIRDKGYKNHDSSLSCQVAKFIYLNKTCFNGLYRENKKGQFNVPMGRYKNPLIYDPDNLRTCAKALEYTTCTTNDFIFSVSKAKKGDFVYFDPPYMSRTGKEFTKYHKKGFNEEDHARLALVARKLKDNGVSVLLSNSDTEEVRDLYEGFELIEVAGKRSVGATEERRGYVGDLLIR